MLRLETPTGPFTVHAQGRQAPARISLVRADSFSARGWRSAYYQHREPALSLSLTRDAAIVRFCTVFGPDGYEVEISPGIIRVNNDGIDAEIVGSSDDRMLISRSRSAESITLSYRDERLVDPPTGGRDGENTH